LEFARMGGSLFGLLPSTGLPDGYGFVERSDGGYKFRGVDIWALSSTRPAQGAVIGNTYPGDDRYPATTHTFVADTITSSEKAYERKNILVPAGTSLIVVIR
jgi:hypothetical protein